MSSLIEAPARASRVPTPTLLLGLAAMLLVLAVLGVAVTDLARSSTFEQTFHTGNATTAPPSTPTTVPAVIGPGPITAQFTFTGDSLSLAPLAGVGRWFSVAGNWGQLGGQAALLTAAAPRSIALVRLDRQPQLVEVTLSRVVDDAGLLLAYVDPSHYLMVVPVSSGRSLSLLAVDGDPAHPKLLLSVPRRLTPGTVIGAEVTATQVSVVVAGQVAGSVKYRTTPGSHTILGLVAAGQGPPDARFDDFVVSP